MQRLTAGDPSSSEIIRTAGLSPDDASNFAPAPERVAERIAGDQAAFQAKLMKMNDEILARTNGGFVQPFFLFPQTVLERRYRQLPHDAFADVAL